MGDGTGNGGNVSAPISTTFNVDISSPTGGITWPAANAAVSSTTVQITGTATDDLSGVKTTQLEISTGTGASQFDWNGSNAWVANANNALADLDYHDHRSDLDLHDPAGRACDADQLLPAPAIRPTMPGWVFTSPGRRPSPTTTRAPNVAITLPTNNGFYSQIVVSTPFAGTSSVPGPINIGMSTVTLSLIDKSNGNFALLTSSPAQGTPATWSYNQTFAFTDDHQYQIDRSGHR